MSLGQVVICLCFAVTLGQATITTNWNCSTDAIALAADFLHNYGQHVSSLPCFQKFAVCHGFELMKTIQICADELKKPELKDPVKLLQIAADTKNNYFNSLHIVCCIKTKEAEINNISMEQILEASSKCLNNKCED